MQVVYFGHRLSSITLIMFAALASFTFSRATAPDPLEAQVTAQRHQLMTLIERSLSSLNSKNMNSPHAEKLIELFSDMHEELQDFDAAYLKSPESLGAAVSLNFTIADHIQEALQQHADEHNLQKLVLKRSTSRSFMPFITPEQITGAFSSTQHAITNIVSQLDSWGTTWINRCARSLGENLQKINTFKVATRSLPYLVLGGTLLYINSPERFENVPVLGTLKHCIGTYKPKTGWVGLDTVQRTLNPAALLIAPVVMSDVKDGYAWLADKTKATLAHLQGWPYSSSPIFYTPVEFKNIIGNRETKEQLEIVAQHAIANKQLQIAGYPMAKGCIIVGNLATGQQLAYACASRITTLLKEKNKRQKCGIYEIHASTLMTKSFEEMTKEVESYSEGNPCVILINEIDWVFAIEKPDGKVIGDLMTNLIKITMPTKKKNCIVIATATNTHVNRITPTLLSANYLGIRLTAKVPTDIERADFLQSELKKKGLDCDQAYLDGLTKKTDGFSQSELIALMNHAFATAQLQQQVFCTLHVDMALEAFAHRQ